MTTMRERFDQLNRSQSGLIWPEDALRFAEAEAKRAVTTSDRLMCAAMNESKAKQKSPTMAKKWQIDSVDTENGVLISQQSASCDPSPELERAEQWFRTCASATLEECGDERMALGCRFAELMVAELDRLRALVARLQSAPSRVVYVPAHSAEEACATVAGRGFFMETRESTPHQSILQPGQSWFAVERRAREVKP